MLEHQIQPPSVCSNVGSKATLCLAEQKHNIISWLRLFLAVWNVVALMNVDLLHSDLMIRDGNWLAHWVSALQNRTFALKNAAAESVRHSGSQWKAACVPEYRPWQSELAHGPLCFIKQAITHAVRCPCVRQIDAGQPDRGVANVFITGLFLCHSTVRAYIWFTETKQLLSKGHTSMLHDGMLVNILLRPWSVATCTRNT